MRKKLGVERNVTWRWISRADCSVCQSLAGLGFPDGDEVWWLEVREHLTDIHIAHELCIHCFTWLDDEDFEDHALAKHGQVWTPR